jgi:hypothetical protein
MLLEENALTVHRTLFRLTITKFACGLKVAAMDVVFWWSYGGVWL